MTVLLCSTSFLVLQMDVSAKNPLAHVCCVSKSSIPVWGANKFVCVYVFICVWGANKFVCVYVYMRVWVCVCVYVYASVYLCVYLNVCVFVYECWCVRISVCVCGGGEG